MCRCRGGAALAALAVWAAGAGAADLTKIDRAIAKQPTYRTKSPKYGLLVFGPEAKTRVWLVLDKSAPDADRYDVLHADLNANGDLTESGERITGRPDGTDLRFHLPDFKDPATGATHTGFSVRVAAGADPTVMVTLQWRGGFKMGGGYPEEAEQGYLKFADDPAAAPVLWAQGDGPFRFQRWYSGKLTIGGSDDFKVFVGQRGLGTNSFWAFQVHFLPEGEGVQATLIYRDARGQEQRSVSRLNDRC
jgi:hypothetical protein